MQIINRIRRRLSDELQIETMLQLTLPSNARDHTKTNELSKKIESLKVKALNTVS